MLDQRLHEIPCGYFALSKDGRITEANDMFWSMLGEKLDNIQIHDVLTTASKLYFQTYFFPLMLKEKAVYEMYITFQTDKHTCPVLLNASMTENRIDCIVVHMKQRDEYENMLLHAKKETEDMLQKSKQEFEKLQSLIAEYEIKKQEMVTLNEQLQQMAMTDMLTGLHNRRMFETQLNRAIELFPMYSRPFSLLVLDVDYFKMINDTFGHSVGDDVLKELAKLLQTFVYSHDVLARMGGEEFSIMLTQSTFEEAMQLAEHIRLAIEQYNWKTIPLTISIGVSSYNLEDTFSTLYTRADDALYEAKRLGRNQVRGKKR